MKNVSRSPVFLSIVMAVAAQAGQNDSVNIASGFVTASKWRSLPHETRMLYALGVVDGMKFSPILASGTQRTTKLAECTSRMDSEQILAIAQKHVDARPEVWHEAVHYRIFESLAEACRLFK